MNPLRIAVTSACNPRYFPGLVVAFYSLLRNLKSGWGVDFIVLSEGWTRSHSESLIRVLDTVGREYSLDVKTIDLAEYKSFRTDWGSSHLAYARLLMPEIVPHDFVLYVDSDIVVGRDISQLFSLPWPDGCLLYAVADPLVQSLSAEGMNTKQIGIPADAPYFNSGFLWTNLKAWRTDGIADKCRYFMRRFPEELRWWDQSVLNGVLWQNWNQLDSSWNLRMDKILKRGDVFHFFKKAINVHYVGPEKPWLTFNAYGQYFDDDFASIVHLVPNELIPYQATIEDKWKRAIFFAKRGFHNYGSYFKQSFSNPRS